MSEEGRGDEMLGYVKVQRSESLKSWSLRCQNGRRKKSGCWKANKGAGVKVRFR